MSNNVPAFSKNSNACLKCGCELSFVGDVRYCEECGECPLILDEEVKIVPRNYRSNAVDYKITALVKVEEHVRDFLLALQIDEPQSKIYQLVEKVMALHRNRGDKCKGYREETAAIVYCTYEFQHKLSIKKFCQRYNLQIRKFNKMYIFHRNMERDLVRQKKLTSESIKLEDKEKISNVKFEEEEKQVKMEVQNWQKQTKQKKKQKEKKKIESSLLQIYDSIFDTTYFQKMKSSFIKDLTEKAVLIEAELKQKEELENVKSYLHYPYLIYGVLKGNGHSISMKRYKSIVECILKVQLRQKLLAVFHKETKSVLKKWEQEDINSESFLTRPAVE